jgi:hypothetical protein
MAGKSITKAMVGGAIIGAAIAGWHPAPDVDRIRIFLSGTLLA